MLGVWSGRGMFVGLGSEAGVWLRAGQGEELGWLRSTAGGRRGSAPGGLVTRGTPVVGALDTSGTHGMLATATPGACRNVGHSCCSSIPESEFRRSGQNTIYTSKLQSRQIRKHRTTTCSCNRSNCTNRANPETTAPQFVFWHLGPTHWAPGENRNAWHSTICM